MWGEWAVVGNMRKLRNVGPVPPLPPTTHLPGFRYTYVRVTPVRPVIPLNFRHA